MTWLVVGLGNPGVKYLNTRHNVGFKVLDLLCREEGVELSERDSYFVGKGPVGGDRVVFLKPLTFMNRSGTAVKKAIRKYNLTPETLIVVHDDLDLPSGALKVRKSGSSGGHKGVESIIQEIGTRDFIRVKVGIGRESGIPVEQYVLGSFKPFERDLIRDAIIKSVEAVRSVLSDGADKAMNRFNRTKPAEGPSV